MFETLSAPVAPPVRREPWKAVFLAVLLGLLAGFVHGWNLSIVGLMLLVVFFNVRARLFFAIWFVGVVLSWLLVPVSYALGRFVLDRTSIGELLGFFGDTPVVSLFGLDGYAVTGGAVLALILTIPAFFTVRGWTQRLRRPDKASVNVGGNRLTRWLFLGEPGSAEHGDLPLVRPLGLWALLVGTGFVTMAIWFSLPKHVERRILATLIDANRAEVNVGSVHVDLWSGEVEIENLAMANAHDASEDWLRVAKLNAKMDVSALLYGRVSIDQLRLKGIEVHSEREHAAITLDEFTSVVGTPALIEESGEPATRTAGQFFVADYLQNWSALQERFARLENLFSFLEALQSIDSASPIARSDDLRHRLHTLIAARSDLGLRRPRLYARWVVLEDLPDDWNLGTAVALKLSDVNSNAARSPRPTKVEFEDVDNNLRCVAVLDLRDQPYRHRVDVKVDNCSLVDCVQPTSSKQRLACESGKAQVVASGWMTHEGIDLKVQIDATDLAAQVNGQAVLAGVASQAWNEALSTIHDLRIITRVEGPLATPTMQVDANTLMRHFSQRLTAQGELQLAAAFTPVVVTERAPSARLLAARNPSADVVASAASLKPMVAKLGQSMDPAMMATHDVATAPRIASVPYVGLDHRISRLPHVALENISLADRNSGLSMTFSPPTDRLSNPAVCQTSDPESPATAAPDPWAPSDANEPDASAVAGAHTRTPDNDATDEFFDEELIADPKPGITTWTNDLMARASKLFKAREREELKNPFDEAPASSSEPVARDTSRLTRGSSSERNYRRVVR